MVSVRILIVSLIACLPARIDSRGDSDPSEGRDPTKMELRWTLDAENVGYVFSGTGKRGASDFVALRGTPSTFRRYIVLSPEAGTFEAGVERDGRGEQVSGDAFESWQTDLPRLLDGEENAAFNVMLGWMGAFDGQDSWPLMLEPFELAFSDVTVGDGKIDSGLIGGDNSRVIHVIGSVDSQLESTPFYWDVLMWGSRVVEIPLVRVTGCVLLTGTVDDDDSTSNRRISCRALFLLHEWITSENDNKWIGRSWPGELTLEGTI